jgi:hemerythrin superfamily protein
MDCLEFVCLIRTHHSIQKNHSQHKLEKISEFIKTIDSKLSNQIVSNLKTAKKMIKTKEEKIEILKNEILELNDDLTKLTEDLDEAMKFKKDFDEMDLIEKLT